MPLLIEGASVQTWKDGRSGYILFTPRDCLTVPVGAMEVQVIIEYDQGYTRVGMGNAYTMNMLAEEFLTLTQDQWKIYPLNGYRRLTDGTVFHRVTGDRDIFQAAGASSEDSGTTWQRHINFERGRSREITPVLGSLATPARCGSSDPNRKIEDRILDVRFLSASRE
jgi:hypothetical protein